MLLAGYAEQLALIREMCPGKISITAYECADILGMNVKTVYSLMQRDRDPLPTKLIGERRRVILITELARWLCRTR